MYLKCQLLDVSEQFDVFFRQVLVAGQLLIFVAPVAAFLIVWGSRHRGDINANLVRKLFRLDCQD